MLLSLYLLKYSCYENQMKSHSKVAQPDLAKDTWMNLYLGSLFLLFFMSLSIFKSKTMSSIFFAHVILPVENIKGSNNSLILYTQKKPLLRFF